MDSHLHASDMSPVLELLHLIVHALILLLTRASMQSQILGPMQALCGCDPSAVSTFVSLMTRPSEAALPYNK